MILLHPLEQLFGVTGRVIFDDLLGVASVDGVDVFLEDGAFFAVDLLDALQSAGSYEKAPSLGVVGQHLTEIGYWVAVLVSLLTPDSALCYSIQVVKARLNKRPLV